MTNNEISIGFDRFISRRWADYSLELYCSSELKANKYQLLRVWLDQQIDGKESSRKTANQLKRLWLNDDDHIVKLRYWAINSGIVNELIFRPVLHFGLAINAFPIFREVCEATGRLTNLQGVCTIGEVKKRVMEKHTNPGSIPRIIDRAIQTLSDWGLVSANKGQISTIKVVLNGQDLVAWVLGALLYSLPGKKLPYSDLTQLPELLGIKLENERSAIKLCSQLSMERDMVYHEVVRIR